MREGFLARRASQLLQRRLATGRGVVVNGPRQAGKTALLKVAQEDRGGTYLSLDVPQILGAARRDPTGLVNGFDPPLWIDEVQRGGDPLVLALKVAMDSDQTKGRFVLAGSSRFLTEPRLSESLAGRVRFVDVWPLSQGEIDGAPDGFVDVLFQDPHQLTSTPIEALSREAVFDRVCRGGFPEAVLADPSDRPDFFQDYAVTVTTRDVRDLERISERVSMLDLARLLAARTSSEANVADLARVAGLEAPALRRYLPLLETIYLHHAVPAWSANLTAKVVRKPKLHMVDTGLAAHLAGVDARGLARPTATFAGPLLETFVAGELARQLTWSAQRATLRHWRDRSGPEVDLLLETAAGGLVAVEVKCAADVRSDDLRGLRILRDRLGDRFVAGAVIHPGPQVLPLEDRIWAVPVAALWSVAPR